MNVNAAEAVQDMFLFSLQSEQYSEEFVEPMIPEASLDNHQVKLPVELSYDAPCDIKCGISTTGLVLLHMYVESKEDQEYRYTLMNPNYEP